MKTVKTETGLTKNLNEVKLHKINQADFGDSLTIKQTIETVYPSKRYNSSLSEGLFNNDSDGESYQNTRYCLVKAPTGITEEEAKEQLSKFPEACIQQIVSNRLNDILSDNDLYAIENGLVTEEELSDRYEMQDSQGNRYIDGKIRVNSDGELLSNTSKREYRRFVFRQQYVEDVDNRSLTEVKEKVKEEAIPIVS